MKQKDKLENEKGYKPMMVSNRFYNMVEQIRAEKGLRTLKETAELLVDFYIEKNKK
jgi:hypothetical protein